MKSKQKNPRGLRAREGNWHYRFMLRGQEYSGNTEMAATTPNINAALQVRTEERRRILSGASPTPELKPFSKAADEFLRWNDGEHREKPATARRTRTSFASLRRFFRTEPLRNVTAGRIERYKSWRREAYIQEITIRHDLHALSLLFSYGKKQGWCATNPVREEVEIPSDEDAIRMYILSDGEERRYFEAALQRSQDLYDVGRIMILQGCRPEEVMRLEQSYCDLKRGRFRITRGKSKAAKRELAMLPETREILARRMQKPNQWVFPSTRKLGFPIAKLINPHNKACEIAGVEIVPYDLRHTYATRMAEAGCPISQLAAILGHGNLRSVMRYVHHDQESMAAAILKYGRKGRTVAPVREEPIGFRVEAFER